MRWIWRLLVDPLEALDLNDASGKKPDHGKVIGFLAFTVFTVFIFTNRLPSVGHTALLLGAVFGSRVFIALIKSRGGRG